MQISPLFYRHLAHKHFLSLLPYPPDFRPELRPKFEVIIKKYGLPEPSQGDFVASAINSVTYTYSSPTTFVKGDKVSITGVTPPSFNFNSAEVLRATSNQLVIAKSLVGTYRSGGSVTLAKSRNVQQIKLSTTVQGQRLTRTITVSN